MYIYICMRGTYSLRGLGLGLGQGWLTLPPFQQPWAGARRGPGPLKVYVPCMSLYSNIYPIILVCSWRALAGFRAPAGFCCLEHEQLLHNPPEDGQKRTTNCRRRSKIIENVRKPYAWKHSKTFKICRKLLKTLLGDARRRPKMLKHD